MTEQLNKWGIGLRYVFRTICLLLVASVIMLVIALVSTEGPTGRPGFLFDVFDLAMFAPIFLILPLMFFAELLDIRHWARWRMAYIPLLILGTLAHTVIASVIIPIEFNRITLKDGRQVILVSEFIPTDLGFALWVKKSGSWFAPWHRMQGAQINYSEDGSYAADPSVHITPDGARILVQRGGIWTDCIVVSDTFRTCEGTASTVNYLVPENWLKQSAKIEALTGMTPVRLQ